MKMAKKTRLSPVEAFLALPDEEKERQCEEFDNEFIADTFRPLTPAQRRRWERIKRKPGRPQVGRGAKVISLSIEQDLLRRSDQLAKKMKVTRAFLVSEGLRHMLAENSPRSRKSA